MLYAGNSSQKGYKLKNQEALWYCEVGITLSGSKNIPGIFNHIKVIYLIITDCVMIFDFDMIVQVFSENEYSAFFVIDHIFVSGIPYKESQPQIVADFIC